MKKRTKEVVCGKGLWVMGYNGNRSGYYRGEREREREIGKGRKVERKVMWLEIWLVM
jgi:hypothetical protein